MSGVDGVHLLQMDEIPLKARWLGNDNFGKITPQQKNKVQILVTVFFSTPRQQRQQGFETLNLSSDIPCSSCLIAEISEA